MQKLTTADIKDLREYERERETFLADVIKMKKRRRVKLGELMSIVFENATTMRFQIQEMARAEKMLHDEQIAQELEVYNALIPEDGELRATCFIEIEENAELREWLPRLVGIEDHVHVVFGDDKVSAREEDAERLTREDITSTVHYFTFSFTAEQETVFAAGPSRIVVDHPEYQAEAVLTDEQRIELAGDFAA
ncbi:MAG: DUF3501 family protein [Actinobacteria bacterium]|nr:DUF3501 family protein [Actinomycetota bacterium]